MSFDVLDVIDVTVEDDIKVVLVVTTGEIVLVEGHAVDLKVLLDEALALLPGTAGMLDMILKDALRLCLPAFDL